MLTLAEETANTIHIRVHSNETILYHVVTMFYQQTLSMLSTQTSFSPAKEISHILPTNAQFYACSVSILCIAHIEHAKQGLSAWHVILLGQIVINY